jgi:cytochrome oxidase Cu insertion factor (SCO1/SenC/PrrC family)
VESGSQGKAWRGRDHEPASARATGAGDTGAPAPPFAFTTLDGDTVTLEALAGKVVVVNFWATN